MQVEPWALVVGAFIGTILGRAFCHLVWRVYERFSAQDGPGGHRFDSTGACVRKGCTHTTLNDPARCWGKGVPPEVV